LDYCAVAYTIMAQQNTHYVYSSYSGSLEWHILFKANANLKPMTEGGNKNQWILGYLMLSSFLKSISRHSKVFQCTCKFLVVNMENQYAARYRLMISNIDTFHPQVLVSRMYEDLNFSWQWTDCKVTKSISTGLYPNLDLWTANKLQLQLLQSPGWLLVFQTMIHHPS